MTAFSIFLMNGDGVAVHGSEAQLTKALEGQLHRQAAVWQGALLLAAPTPRSEPVPLPCGSGDFYGDIAS